VHDRRASTSWKSMYAGFHLVNITLTIPVHEQIDADTFASWGADLLKCKILDVSNCAF
jgi:hypothetical protein